MTQKNKIMKINVLGLPVKETELLTKELNVLLSNFQVYYQNLRGVHWNIKGKRFFDLHIKFEELYNDSQLKIDMIAERILTLGATPYHTFEDYLANNKVDIAKNVFNDEKAIQMIVLSLTELLKIERNILKKSDEIDDEGTNSMMSDFIKEQEKTIWMMKSWLNEKI